MILPWLKTEYAGQTLDYIGTDDPENPYTIKTFNFDMKPFFEYPYEVKYKFNSRGFRDEEWPDDDKLRDAVWCLGDSSGMGAGIPYHDSWYKVLERETGVRTINIATPGNGYDENVDIALRLMKELQPKTLIISWTWIHRNSGHEERRRKAGIHNLGAQALSVFKKMFVSIDMDSPDVQDVKYCLDKIKLLEASKGNTQLIHVFLDPFSLRHELYTLYIKKVTKLPIIYTMFKLRDVGRDQYFHYGIASHREIADGLLKLFYEKNINIGR